MLALAVSSGLLISIPASGQPQYPPAPIDSSGTPAMAGAVPILAAPDLDKLVAPIALYPDPLLAQILPASTYPLEVVQASRWSQQHKGLKGQELEAAVAGEPWAASVKALCPFLDVLGYMDSHLDWTTQLGDAVLNQEQDVLDAIQRMRLLAQTAGTLQSNDKQVVEVEEVGDRRVVVIRPYEPELIYVPVYDPGVVYYRPRHYVQDDWAYGLFGFGVGVLASSMFWDWDCDWYGRRIVYDRDRHRRSHHRFDWDDYNWDRYDWRRGDRIRQGGFDFDISYINIDNIDINRYDWRRSDPRRFDWNRADWRGVNFDRLEFGKRDWKDVDWAAAGIRNPQLVESLRKLPPGDREQLRQRFEKAHRNQQYKDKIGKLQKERLLGDKAPQVKATRWEHEPEHRRGVAYKGPAKEHFEKRVSGERREGVSQRPDGVGPGRGIDDTRRGGGIDEAMRDVGGKPKGDKERSAAIVKALRDHELGGARLDASSRKGQGTGDFKASDKAARGGGLKATDVRDGGSQTKGDKERSTAILKALRDRELGGAQLDDSFSRKGERSGATSQQQTQEVFRKNKGDDKSRQAMRGFENSQPSKQSNDRPKVRTLEQPKTVKDSGGQRSSSKKQPNFERKSSGGGDQQAMSNKGASRQQVNSNKGKGGRGDRAKGDDKDGERKKD